MNLCPSARRTGNKDRPELAQTESTQDILTGLDFFGRIIGKGYTDCISNSFIEKRPDADS